MKILVAYDGSMHADAAIDDMLRAGLPDEAEALVLTVAHDATAASLADGDARAADAATRIQSFFPQWKICSEVLWGAPAHIILERCDSWHPDLLIVGSHGHSAVGRFFLGSVSQELVVKAPCSVRVVRLYRTGGTGPIRIVIGNDGSPQSEAAVREVARRFWPRNTEAQIVCVVNTLAPAPVGALEAATYSAAPAFKVIEEADAREWKRLQRVAEDSERLLAKAGLSAGSIIISAQPQSELIAEAVGSNADAIFVGARGIGRMERLLLGSVSTAVVNLASCTVEVVRPRKWDG